MSPQTPRSWLDRLAGACFTLLAAALALYGAVAVVRTLLPTLLPIMGGLALAVTAVAAVRWYRGRW
ncbi:hypothetical protein IM877_02365 [Rhodococcus sp. GG48]|nr:hypothetical protein [Rhodococcus sp. GG48]